MYLNRVKKQILTEKVREKWEVKQVPWSDCDITKAQQPPVPPGSPQLSSSCLLPALHPAWCNECGTAGPGWSITGKQETNPNKSVEEEGEEGKKGERGFHSEDKLECS